MYAAYQSHQSCGGATASNEPCCSAVSCKSAASEATSISVLPLTTGEPGSDLLEYPAISVGVAEGRAREIGAPSLRVETRGHGLLDHADVHAATDQVVPGDADVRDHEKRLLRGSRLGCRAGLAELNRALRMRRCELHGTHLVADDQVDVQPPPQALVEALCPIDIGHGQGHDLEVHVNAQST